MNCLFLFTVLKTSCVTEESKKEPCKKISQYTPSQESLCKWKRSRLKPNLILAYPIKYKKYNIIIALSSSKKERASQNTQTQQYNNKIRFTLFFTFFSWPLFSCCCFMHYVPFILLLFYRVEDFERTRSVCTDITQPTVSSCGQWHLLVVMRWGAIHRCVILVKLTTRNKIMFKYMLRKPENVEWGATKFESRQALSNLTSV